jgi:hypothetical protein
MKQQRVDRWLPEGFERLRAVPPPDPAHQAEQRRAFMSQVQRYSAGSRRARGQFRPARLASRRLALAGVLVALLLVVVGGSGVIYAADAAAPGDALYGLDQTVESVRLSLTTRPQATTRLLIALAQERLAEAEELSSRGDSEHLAVALDGLSTVVASLAQAPAPATEEDGVALAALIDQEFASQAAPVAATTLLTATLPPPDDDQPEPGELPAGACVGAEPQPAAQRLADQYGVGYDEVMGWFCEGHYGLGEIMLALQTAEKTGLDAGDLLAMKAALGGWGQVWQALGLIGGRPTATVTVTITPTATATVTVTITPTVEPSPVVTGTATPTSTVVVTNCVGADPHPVARRLADEYGVGYDDVMGWFCGGRYGLGEIKIALEAGQALDMLPEDLLALKTELGGWGQVWHSLGLKGKPKKLAGEPSPTDPAATSDQDQGPGNSSKAKATKEPKPDQAAKPDKVTKPDKAPKPENAPKPEKTPKPTKTPKPGNH